MACALVEHRGRRTTGGGGGHLWDGGGHYGGGCTVGARATAQSRRYLMDLEAQTAEALKPLRDVAQGIYPPALRDHGLAEALRKHVEVSADGIGRYDPEVEAAVYFCCLEAIQNATKYANAARIAVKLHQEDGHLAFSVVDDGVGFDPAVTGGGTGLQNMTDRVASLGGTFRLQSRPGRGTTVSGVMPA